MLVVFFFNDTATTEIYTLSLHDALPICSSRLPSSRLASALGQQLADVAGHGADRGHVARVVHTGRSDDTEAAEGAVPGDRKSTRLNSSHANISYAVFCLKKKNKKIATHL